jgi:hypothetical protein
MENNELVTFPTAAVTYTVKELEKAVCLKERRIREVIAESGLEPIEMKIMASGQRAAAYSLQEFNEALVNLKDMKLASQLSVPMQENLKAGITLRRVLDGTATLEEQAHIRWITERTPELTSQKLLEVQPEVLEALMAAEIDANEAWKKYWEVEVELDKWKEDPDRERYLEQRRRERAREISAWYDGKRSNPW